MRRVKPYLQLVRLPNLFTAAADPLAGWLLVGGSLGNARGWLPLVGAGVSIYAAGMILNDVFDLEIDRVERPGRPLPSGRVSRRLAATFGAGLLVLGPALAALAGMTSLMVALVLAACVLGYDGGLKRTLMGPQVMGSCRSLNLLLGMSLAHALGGPPGWLAAFAFGLFVTGVTWISRDEAAAEGGKARGVFVGLWIEWVASLTLPVAAWWMGTRAEQGDVHLSGVLIGVGVLVAVLYFVEKAGFRALREPTPGRLQAAVKTGVLSLVWLDVALVAMVRGPAPALAVAALWVPAFLLGKWLYST
jgi:4-hydroxybenzoate polyprenyltransferase